MAKDLFIAFWNIENLFDVETAPRSEKLRKMVAADLVGWDDTWLAAKCGQLSTVIRALNSGAGPDVLGVCEVESRAVLDKLVARIAADGGRSYAVAHADAGDNRGIDVAFLYDPAIATADKQFQHWIVKRYATRELFQVNFLLGGRTLVLIGNHWPSRTAGQYESEPYRMIAGETLAYWVERIQEELGRDAAVVVLGDFNDEPFNRAVAEYALSISDASVVGASRSQNAYLLNLMWPIVAAGRGSHVYDGRWNMLDQIMVSRGIVTGKGGWQVKGGASVEATVLMAHPTKPGPKRFGIKPNQRDQTGFSDHFPVSVTLTG